VDGVGVMTPLLLALTIWFGLSLPLGVAVGKCLARRPESTPVSPYFRPVRAAEHDGTRPWAPLA
jgi:hypothetical protein